MRGQPRSPQRLAAVRKALAADTQHICGRSGIHAAGTSGRRRHRWRRRAAGHGRPARACHYTAVHRPDPGAAAAGWAVLGAGEPHHTGMARRCHLRCHGWRAAGAAAHGLMMCRLCACMACTFVLRAQLVRIAQGCHCLSLALCLPNMRRRRPPSDFVEVMLRFDKGVQATVECPTPGAKILEVFDAGALTGTGVF